jgi:8-oxo-dGTP pyrophosphatase MutT (NUDIX family)
MRVQFASVLVYCEEDGAVLLLQRGPTAPSAPLEWNLPGGEIDATDATASAAALRECREEAGDAVHALVASNTLRDLGEYDCPIWHGERWGLFAVAVAGPSEAIPVVLGPVERTRNRTEEVLVFATRGEARKGQAAMTTWVPKNALNAHRDAAATASQADFAWLPVPEHVAYVWVPLATLAASENDRPPYERGGLRVTPPVVASARRLQLLLQR